MNGSRILYLCQAIGKLFIGCGKVAVFVEVSYHQFCSRPDLRRQRQRAKLPRQMIAERARLRQKILKRRLVVLLEV